MTSFLQVWNDFINQTEDEQERLLAGEWVPLTVVLTDKADEEDMEKEFEIIDKREGVNRHIVLCSCFVSPLFVLLNP